MKKLQQLRISKGKYWELLYPDRSTVYIRLLRLLKVVCLSLQFVKLGYGAEAWEITTRGVELSGHQSHITSEMIFRKLSLEEIESMKLFAINTRDLSCGITTLKPMEDEYNVRRYLVQGNGVDRPDDMEVELLMLLDEVERPYLRQLARIRIETAADVDRSSSSRDYCRNWANSFSLVQYVTYTGSSRPPSVAVVPSPDPPRVSRDRPRNRGLAPTPPRSYHVEDADESEEEGADEMEWEEDSIDPEIDSIDLYSLNQTQP